MLKTILAVLLCIGMLVSGAGCGQNGTLPDAAGYSETEGTETMILKINGTEVPVLWEKNESVSAIADELAAGNLTVQMQMYGGFEQVGRLGKRFPSDDRETTTACGDIVLYSSSQIVLFYGSNSWAYTRLGHIDLPADKIIALLANGAATIELSR